MHKFLKIVLFSFLALFLLSTLEAQTPGPIRLRPFMSGFDSPIKVTSARDGSERIFVVERPGVIKVIHYGTKPAEVYLDIRHLVSTEGEGGLLGLAFGYGFRDNGKFYVFYTRKEDGAIQVSEFRQDPRNHYKVLPTEFKVITIPHPDSRTNYGGAIFAGDLGALYIATGDGGGTNDPFNNAQNKDSLLGKVLRITPGSPSDSSPYTIPRDNPFYGSIPGADEVYALGFRDPFDAEWGHGSLGLWIADRGQNWQELNYLMRGGNYGWRAFEGNSCTNIDPSLCISPSFIAPKVTYSSSTHAGRCKLAGVTFYGEYDRRYTFFRGSSIYADRCTGEIITFYNGESTVIADIENDRLVSIGRDDNGEVYLVKSDGTIDKITKVKKPNVDVDGDGRSDLVLYRPATHTWYGRSTRDDRQYITQWGEGDDHPYAGNFDDDNKLDYAIYRPSNGHVYFLYSSGGYAATPLYWRFHDFVPAADYTGSGRDAVGYSTYAFGGLAWYGTLGGFPMPGQTSQAVFGGGFIFYPVVGDPVPGDYWGVGTDQAAVFDRATGTWTMRDRNLGYNRYYRFGEPGDIPTPGDFDDDGFTEMAVYRPSNGTWYIRISDDSWWSREWGEPGDIPVVGDYDGDGKDDIAQFRPSTGYWYVIGSTSGPVRYGQWGEPGDIPVATFDRP